MHNVTFSFTFVCWLIALICFAIAGLNWVLPTSPRRAWNWTAWGYFFVLLPFVFGGVDLGVCWAIWAWGHFRPHPQP